MGMTLELLDNVYTGNNFIKDLGWLVTIIVTVAGALMTLYAVYIFYLFFTASDPTKRKAAKDRVIKIVSSALIIYVMAAALAALNISWTTQTGNYSGPSGESSGLGGESNYTYSGKPECTLKATYQQGGMHIVGEFTLTSTELLGDGSKIDKYGTKIQFTECLFTSPTGWPGSEIKISGQPTVTETKTIDQATGGEYTVFTVRFSLIANGKQAPQKVRIPVLSLDPAKVKISMGFVERGKSSKHTVPIELTLINGSKTMLEFGR